MTNAKQFRFGINARVTNAPNEWRELARKAEELGYSSLLMPDHFSDQFGVLTALTAAAVSTTVLRIGTNVLDNDFRHPAVLAKEIATLDLFSGGRVELGVGAGWQAADYQRTGLSFDAPRTRFERLREAVRVLRGLFSPGPFSFEGKYYQFKDYDGLPKPKQSPMPLTLGAGGPRMLELAATEADIVNFVPRALPEGALDLSDTSVQSFEHKAERVRKAAGERYALLEIATLIHQLFVTDGASDAATRAEQVALRFKTDVEEALDRPIVLVGEPACMVDKLLERRERFGLNYLCVLGHNMEAFAPVVAALRDT
jgi:probable F420-dependent oxidoreductase